MTKYTKCPIWGTPANSITGHTSDGEAFDSPRAGGKFYVVGSVAENLHTRDEHLKTKLTSLLAEQRGLGEQLPKIYSTTIKEANERSWLSISERTDRSLKYIQSQTSHIGDGIELIKQQDVLNTFFQKMSGGESLDKRKVSLYFDTLKIQAFSESTNLDEVVFLLRYLNTQKWIAYEDRGGILRCELTVEGYARLAQLEKKDTQSSRAFVAMWFDDSMDDLWEKGIEPGIKDAGYVPVRIDREEHVNKIDDEIIAEIRRSRFVVADFTHGGEGARGGVYYEAGFAHGMNIPVIFSCKKSIIKEIHFDTRQYNHIIWEKPEELREQLANRIAAVIGDGPNKNGT